MSRRKKKPAKPTVEQVPAPPEPERLPWMDYFRRGLLGFITALIVARPFILSEDPGLLDRLTGTGNQFLSLLWLVALVGWAVYRFLTNEGGWFGSFVEVGLLGVVAFVFLGAGMVASYKRPAIFTGWEWLVFLVAFCLVRQLARTQTEQRGLLAAMLAAGLSISAYALYQANVDIPVDRQRYGDHPELLLQEAAKQGLFLDKDSIEFRAFAKRIQDGDVFGTFGHPNSFAGYLALLLPVLAGWTVAAWRARRGPAWSVATGICLAVMLLALWYTHSKGAILALLLVALFAAVLLTRRLWLAQPRLAAVWVLAIFLLVFAGLRVGPGRALIDRVFYSFQVRMEYRAATVAMIKDHPWLGVGAGNFDRFYPRYMSETAVEQIRDPHNFMLEVWANAGVFALAALLLALVVFFKRTFAHLWKSQPILPETAPYDEPTQPWEYYLGGMAGLILGFVYWAWQQTSPDVILLQGLYIAAPRSVLWFPAFALFFHLPWSGPWKTLALTGGVIALLLNLTVSGGISFPSVAQPLWVLAALALNTLPEQPIDVPSWDRIVRLAPIPIAGGLCLAYLLLVQQPVSDAAAALRELQLPRKEYRGGTPEQVFHSLKGAMERAKMQQALAATLYCPSQPLPTALGCGAFEKGTLWLELDAKSRCYEILKEEVIPPLVRAVNSDRGDSSLRAELAQWYGELAIMFPGARIKGLPEGPRVAALKEAQHAIDIDPNGKHGYLAIYQLTLQLAERLTDERRRKDRQTLLDTASRALADLVSQDPTDARLRFQMAELLRKAGKVRESRLECQEAERLDEAAGEAGRTLSDRQRTQVRQWLDEETRP
jgi:O-antigen ligase